MSRMDERAVARKLAERDDIEPPAGLLDKIKGEIPAEIRVAPELAAAAGRQAEEMAMPQRQRWLIAATIVAAVGAGIFGLQLREQATSFEEAEAPALSKAERERAVAPEAAAPRRPAPSAPELYSQPEPMAEEQAAAEDSAVRKEAKIEALGYVEGRSAAEQLDLPQEVADELRRQTAAYPAPPPPAAPAPEELGVVAEEITVTGKADVLSMAISGTTYELEKVPQSRRVGGAMAPSTGGTDEPNDRPYGDVFFKTHGTNPFIDTEDDRLSTFGLDVDTGSYTVARRYLADDNLPDPDSVRVEEFVNFFRYGDRPPARGDFAIAAEGAPTPFTLGERYRLVRFNVRGREVKAENRKPAVLTFVVDVSGSMNMENRLGLVKKALGLLLDQLKSGDRIGLVVYGSQGHVLLEPTGDREAVRRAIERLVPEGSTNAEEGIALGYDVAARHFREGAVNRIVLCSDGVANVGATGPESILAGIGREARRGIELTTLGFGMGNYNDVLMEQLANKGDGRYAYIDTLDEARRVLVEELTGTLQTIAKDAKVQVDWNAEAVERYRLLGYENRDIADEKFRDDSVDAGEIGAGHSVTALYEIKLRPDVSRGETLGTLRLRWRSPETERVSEIEKDLRLSDLAPSWEAASPALHLAAVAAEFAEVLKKSYWAKDGSFGEVFRHAQQVAAEFPGNADVAELASLAGKAARLERDRTDED